jgi:hypothetical protein
MSNMKKETTEQYSNKISSYLEDCYFDVQGVFPGKLGINETQVIRLVTKISVGLVTVWWSSLELKTILKSYKSVQGG